MEVWGAVVASVFVNRDVRLPAKGFGTKRRVESAEESQGLTSALGTGIPEVES
jgi:hypothetical protein